MALTNTPKPTTSLTNSTKAFSAETWQSITTTWLAETRTWLGVGSLMANGATVTSSVTNTARPA